ncbi:hypothetical protein Tco_0051169 [Tanacetum coccineum]
MNDKMKDLKCVKKKVKISLHNYSKENYLATFTPQKQLTPEQIFCSKDLIKMKAEALKEQTTTSRPIKALTVVWSGVGSQRGGKGTGCGVCDFGEKVRRKIYTSLNAGCRVIRFITWTVLVWYKFGQLADVALVVVQIILWYLDSGCSKHMTGDRSWLRNFMKKFIRTVRFENDHFGAIMGYGDYVIGDSVISRVYYVEGLGHNMFSVGQFCDSDLEVAFRKHSCYVRDTDGVELIKGSRGSNLYTISVEDMMKSSPICLLSKASKNKSWL